MRKEKWFARFRHPLQAGLAEDALCGLRKGDVQSALLFGHVEDLLPNVLLPGLEGQITALQLVEHVVNVHFGYLLGFR